MPRVFPRHTIGLAVAATVTMSILGATHSGMLASPLAASASAPITCDVTAYGADPSGTNDSTLAIRQAVTVCEATPGPNTVFLPAGTYMLSRNDGGIHGSNNDILISGGYPIIFAGAGASSTRIVEWVGSKSLCGTVACTPKDLLCNLTDGVRVTGVTLDSQTYDAARTFQTSASNVTLDNSAILGGDHIYDLRFNGGRMSPKTAPIYATGNVVHDVVVNDLGNATYDGFDFSFQKNGQIYNINHTGSRLGLYVVSQVTVTNYTFTPGTQAAAGASRGFFITPPSDHVTITGFHSYGQGGVISPDPTFRSDTISIVDEQIYNATSGAGVVNQLQVGDTSNLTIDSSSFPRLFVTPNVSADHISMTSSTAAQVWCYPSSGGSVVSLTGLACPTTSKVKSSKLTITQGETVTLTATVTSQFGVPDGTATFSANGAVIGRVALSSGSATLSSNSLPLGGVVIGVTYSGGAVLAPSTSPTFTEHVR